MKVLETELFYQGEAVRSSWFGMGLVINSGDQPRVRFLEEREFIVPSNTLTAIPQWMLDDEVLNRQAWERYLNHRIYQVEQPSVAFLPSPRLDLLKAMEQSSCWC